MLLFLTMEGLVLVLHFLQPSRMGLVGVVEHQISRPLVGLAGIEGVGASGANQLAPPDFCQGGDVKLFCHLVVGVS